MTFEFGYSPCPNDTFMFWAWAHGKLSSDLVLRPKLADIQELNRWALERGSLPLTKVSASTYLEPQVQERYRLLNAGAALGRGCGPLVVSRQPWSPSEGKSLRIAVPGFNTTACRLARAALADHVADWVELRYDEIMPATVEGRVDAGVIIHESRFTYHEHGLRLAFDLGSWWEELTGLPLPLGVMLAHRDLDESTIAAVEQTMAASIKLAWQLFGRAAGDADAQALWTYLRDNAIELNDATIAAHIKLYVNEYSKDLGDEGHLALHRFAQLPP